MKRLEWVDAARGIGILAVVWGHTIPGLFRTSIYVWHMPFFFLLSGFVYRVQGTFPDYVRHRARQLLVPYALWMAIVMLPSLLAELRRHDVSALQHRLFVVLFGGSALAGPTTPYWFITSLYLSLVAYDALCRWCPRWTTTVCVVLYLLACLRSALIPSMIFPWEADAVLLALPFIHLGRNARQLDWTERRPILAGGTAIFLVAAFLLTQGVRIPAYDIKGAYYGVPVESFVLALAGSLFVVALAKSAGPATRVLAYFGRASLLIVLTHTTLAAYFSKSPRQEPPFLQFVVCAAVPIALFALLSRWAWTRRYLLGETPKTSPKEPSPLSDDIAQPA